MTSLNAAATALLEEEVPEGKNVLHVLDDSGDVHIIWDPANVDEVKSTKKQFDDLLKKGFRAFTVNREGGKDKQIREFDPKAEKVILAPALAGG